MNPAASVLSWPQRGLACADRGQVQRLCVSRRNRCCLKHASTRALFDYWNRLRGERAAPPRSDIDPAAIRQVLGDTFMLAADFIDGLRFRLAGTRVCALFGREMKGEDFNALWNEAGRAQITVATLAVVDEANGLVAGVTGRTDQGAETELELLLLPIRGDRRTRVRGVGILAPLERPYWLGGRPLVELELRARRYLGAGPADPCLTANDAGPRTRHGFLVYSGGREPGPNGGTN
jgi:hypothetical protein